MSALVRNKSVGSKSSEGRLPCGRERPTSHQSSFSPQRREELKKRLDEFLAEQGLKRSEQRWQIVELILDEGGHLNAQQLVKKVADQYPSIGAATVYRNLKTLCDAKILRETLTDVGGRAVYEPYVDDHHDHVVCLDCQAVFEFADEKIEKLQDELLEEMGFREERHRHIVYVRCEKLKRA